MSYTTRILKQSLERFARQHGLNLEARGIRAEIVDLCAAWATQLAQTSHDRDALRVQLAPARPQGEPHA